jgi:endo-1,3-1,4-beta-glycanase ExoK
MKTVRSARWLIFAVAGMVGACAENSSPLAPEPEAEPAAVRSAAVGFVDGFHGFDTTRWSAEDHPLGKGAFYPRNVQPGDGVLRLLLPAGTYDGGEIKSLERFGHGAYEVRMKTPHAPGSISAFFLYQHVPGHRNDEIDIEIHNDGSRRIMFTVWVAGRETHHVTRILPFDPSAGFNDYRFEWAPREVRFYANGVLMQRFTGTPARMPRNTMHLMASTWWPNWLNGPQPAETAALEIDRIIARPD